MVSAGVDGPQKDELTFVSRTADLPGQTINVALCFVPADHGVEAKLPAVSGSSGRLVISAVPSETERQRSRGKVFADESLDYTEAMLQFVAASRDADGLTPAVPSEALAADEPCSLKAQKQAWQREADELRVERRQTRAQRKVEDRVWKAMRERQPTEPKSAAPAPPSDETAEQPTCSASAESWRSLRAQRRAQQKQRRAADELWRQRRRCLRELLSA